MKRLLKLLIFLGAIVLVGYMLKSRLVPVPEPPSADPPRYRTAPPAQPPAPAASADAAAGDDAADDLTEIKGIGPVYRGRLAEAGITTFAGLAAAGAAAVAETAQVSEEAAADWIAQAQARSG